MKRVRASDRVGTTLNNFKILDYKRENNRTYFYVICPLCKNKKWMRADVVNDSRVVSCGCYNEKENFKKATDITGQRSGRLIAKYPTEERDKSNGSVIWLCECDCGKTTKVAESKLRQKEIKSCGCLRVENSKKAGKKVAEYMRINNHVENTNLVSLTQKARKENISGHKGVVWDKERKKWKAQIGLKGKKHHLGRYEDIADAIKVRAVAEDLLFNPILDKYGRNKLDNTSEKRARELVKVARWTVGYCHAQEYFAENKNLRVVANYKTKTQYPLGRWITAQRLANRKGELREEWRLALEKLEIEWNPKKTDWDKHYLLLKEVLEREEKIHHQLIYKGINLYNWINLQKKKIKDNTITAEQHEKLRKIGFVEAVTWEEYRIKGYNHAVDYYKKHGNLLVPALYKTEDGFALGLWINARRNARKGIGAYAITEEQIKMLDDIGMVWDARAVQWEEKYQEARTYYLKNKVLPTPENNKPLHRWITNQKTALKGKGRRKMTEERREKLKEIGIYD